MVIKQNDIMCHGLPMASLSLILFKGRQINVTLWTVGTEVLRGALVNFDVTPYLRLFL